MAQGALASSDAGLPMSGTDMTMKHVSRFRSVQPTLGPLMAAQAPPCFVPIARERQRPGEYQSVCQMLRQS